MNNLLRKFFFPSLILSSLFTKAEGTKQLRPAYTDDAHIVTMAPDNNFAAYNSPADNRLIFHIENLNERVYFGFGNLKIGDALNIGKYNEIIVTSATLLYYRIVDPANVVVMSGLVPTSPGLGYIGNESMAAYNMAVSGPSQFIGASGYNALKFIPNTIIGDYRIEFNIGDISVQGPRTKTSFQLFDLTVTDGKGTFDSDGADLGPLATKVIDGRLWSKAWRLSTGANQPGGDPFNQNLFKAKLYPYAEDGNPLTNDGVVTEINFNGMDPYGFTVSCNRDGISNATGNFVLDKQSVYNVVSPLPPPLYKVFLHDPDPIVYPSGVVGCITQDPTVTQCTSGSAYCINVYAIAVGDVSVVIDLDANGIYEPGTSDVLLLATIDGDYHITPKCVAWDGKDGFGTQVPNGNIPIIVEFHAGLTNLPINDVENNINGFQVSLVRPNTNSCGAPITPPKLYWSDKKVEPNTIAPYTAVAIDGIENLAGCDPTTQGPGIGCHRWSGRGNNTDPTGMGYVMETMNTWWYVAEDKRTINFLNDNSLFGISANFGNVTCNFNEFSNLTVDVEYSVAKFDPTTFVYTITPPPADNYQFISQTILSNSLPGSSSAKRVARIQYTLDINKNNINDIGATNNGLSFDYKVETNQCGTPQQVSQSFVCATPLPVSWIYFWANKINDKTAVLEWTTSQEISNNGFWIERSIDGKTFTTLDFVKGNQNINEKSKYTYTDNQAPSTICYYRLKQIDNQDVYNYSKIISVSSDTQNLSLLSCFYENADKLLKIELVQSIPSDINLTLYNILGATVNQKSFGKISANQPIELQTHFPQLSTGIYIVEIKSNQQIVRKKIYINN